MSAVLFKDGGQLANNGFYCGVVLKDITRIQCLVNTTCNGLLPHQYRDLMWSGQDLVNNAAGRNGR